jgi:hypothetical protein
MKQFKGYKISRNYVKLTIWHFNAKPPCLTVTTTTRPDSKLSRLERYEEICKVMKIDFGFSPIYQKSNKEPL